MRTKTVKVEIEYETVTAVQAIAVLMATKAPVYKDCFSYISPFAVHTAQSLPNDKWLVYLNFSEDEHFACIIGSNLTPDYVIARISHKHHISNQAYKFYVNWECERIAYHEEDDDASKWDELLTRLSNES